MSSTKSATALRSFDELPGPGGWPLLANLLRGRASRIHQQMEAWSRSYGSPFGVKLGTKRVLVVADHETIVAVLRERPDVFRRASKLQEVNEELGGAPGLFDSEGQAWRDQRRMVMASFAPHHVRAFFPYLLSVTQRLRARWQRAAMVGRSIDLQADLKRYTVDAIAGLAFGSDVGSLESADDPIHRHLDIVFAGTYRRLMSPLPYWRWLRLPADRQLERSVAALKVAITTFIARARERLQADPDLHGNPRNLLEAMIAATEADGAAALDERHVAGNVSTMLFAGEDTTANTLAWLIYLLARHPQALQAARDETRRLAPDPAHLVPEQLDRLVYLDACVSEAMRLKPVAPFLVVEALRDTTVADVAVPAGTIVWCAMRHDNLSARHFADPGAFDPQRWLSGSDKRVSMPFGAGPRICPGRYLALLEIKLAMAMLLGSFDIDSVATLDGRDADEVMSFTMNPVALRMRLSVPSRSAHLDSAQCHSIVGTTSDLELRDWHRSDGDGAQAMQRLPDAGCAACIVVLSGEAMPR